MPKNGLLSMLHARSRASKSYTSLVIEVCVVRDTLSVILLGLPVNVCGVRGGSSCCSGHDCGVFVMVLLDLISMRLEQVVFDQQHVRHVRKKLLLSLLEGKIAHFPDALLRYWVLHGKLPLLFQTLCFSWGCISLSTGYISRVMVAVG